MDGLDCCFFFSSRRRHTRWNCDWSSDVYSSDLSYFYQAATTGTGKALDDKLEEIIRAERQSLRDRIEQSQTFSAQADQFTSYLSILGILRSEERRVGKECRTRWSQDTEKNNKMN